jgi:hypothetical protein
MPPSYGIAIDPAPPEERARLLVARSGYQQADGARPAGTRVLALRPRGRVRIAGSYGPCRAPHADEGSAAPIPHYHYFVRRMGTKVEAIRSDFLAGHP